MKTHAIIPIFVPHEGCPHDCIFCDQKAITSRSEAPSRENTIDIIERNLKTIKEKSSIKTVEIAFYGGSFTAIPPSRQNMYLEIASHYKKNRIVDKLHLSTRPDCINEDILNNLKRYGVDIIELGVQSFDSEVLKLSARGHDTEVVYRSSEMIKNFGFTLGIQLMIGLPGDSYESCMYSVARTISIKPEIARLYPTVVIRDTALADMYEKGTYKPLSEADAVNTTKDMYKALTNAGIHVIRIGLKSTDNIRNGGYVLSGDYHPAFRQLVEAEISKEILEKQLLSILDTDNFKKNTDPSNIHIEFSCNPSSFSNMVGNKASNKIYFSEKYPSLNIKFSVDKDLPINEFSVDINKLHR